MTHPRPADDGPGDAPPPSWMGAPGYSPPPPNLAPHAPMPGAPPYPPHVEHPPAPVGDRGRTGFGRALAAAAGWALVSLVLVLVVSGPAPSAAALGRVVGALLVSTLFAAVGTWLVLRRRARAFWVVLLVALPFFAVVRLLTAVAAS